MAIRFCLVCAAIITIFTALASAGNIKATVNIVTPAARLSVISFNGPTSAIQGSQATFYATIKNFGVLATSNVILNLSINGSTQASIIESIGGLAPYQSANVIFTMANATTVEGSDIATLSANYISTNGLTNTTENSIIYIVTSKNGEVVRNSTTSNVFLVLSPNNTIAVNLTGSNTILNLRSQTGNKINEKFIILNLTSNSVYESIPAPSGRQIKDLLIGIYADPSNSLINYTINTPYTCGADNPAPFELSAGSWVSISAYAINTVACSISFQIDRDLVFGIFSSSNVSVSSESPSGNGGGGGGGIATGSYGGGTFRPSVSVLNGTCYELTNMTPPLYSNVEFTAQSFNIRDNYITPGYAGVTINNASVYAIYPNETVSIYSGGGYNYTIDLKNISYIPSIHTVKMEICSVPLSASLKGINTTFVQAQQQVQNLNLINTMPELSFETIPIISGILSSTESVASMTVENLQSFPELMNLSVPSEFAGILKLPAKSIVLNPKQKLQMSLLYSALGNLSSGTYYIPLNITTTANGQKDSQTEYLIMTVASNSTKTPTILNNIALSNNTQNATGIMELIAPSNENISESDVELIIPYSAAKSISDISASGLSAKITNTGSAYQIEWQIGSLPSGTVAYGYYSIKDVEEQAALNKMQSIFIQPSKVSPSQVLRIIHVGVPLMYIGQSANITVQALYTGSNYTVVSFALGGSDGYANINNASQSFGVAPNGELTTTFNIKPHVSGTIMLMLYVYGDGQNITEQVPALVSPSSVSLPEAPLEMPALIALIILLVVVAALIVKQNRTVKRFTRYNIRDREGYARHRPSDGLQNVEAVMRGEQQRTKTEKSIKREGSNRLINIYDKLKRAKSEE